MRVSVLLAGFSFLFGCTAQPNKSLVMATSDGPSAELVGKLERSLSNDQCLSGIATMRREYRYAWRDGKVDRNLIDIKVQEAGVDGLPSGRYVLSTGPSTSFDDRPYFVALATYAVSRGALDLWACGGNTSGSVRHKPIY